MTKFKSRNPARILLSIPFILVLLVIAADAQGDKVANPQPASRDIVTSLPAVSSNTQTDRLPAGVPADIRAHEARISPGDVVDVKIFGLPEMSQELRVSGAGIIVLPLIGSITAQGLTTSELEQKIAEALRNGGFVNDPQVNVSAKELHSSGVSVSGEVGKPGIYPVFGSCSLTDLIMAAGGLTPKSGHLVTVTHRDRPDAPINVDISSASANSGQNVAVFSGDTVVVTKAGVVYVLGDVGRPAGLVMEGDERMTVLQALALAGGANKDAKIKSARIIRKSSQGVQDVPIPLKEILSAQKQDIELQPGDVFFIPGSNREGFWRSEGSILQAATLLAVFRP
jgi:polysaccharide biosynthesis/export protein